MPPEIASQAREPAFGAVMTSSSSFAMSRCVTGRKSFVADANGERATTPRHDALIIKTEAQVSQRSFQTRG